MLLKDGYIMPGPQRKERECISCGAIFLPPKGTRNTWRCSLHQRKNITVESAAKDKTRKKILIREHGQSCWVCKNTEWMGSVIPIQLDHINGDCEDNRKENLRLICPNCHAQTDTFAGKNKGAKPSKRNTYRKKYYVPSLRISQGRGHGDQTDSKPEG